MKYLIALLFFFLLSCCEKDNTDYRDKYIGNYYFVIVTLNSFVPPPHFDTTYYNGIIEKNNKTTDRIYVRFGTTRWCSFGNPPGDTCIGTDYPNTVLNSDRTLSYPEWGPSGNFYFKGKFISTDSINLTMSVGGHAVGTIKYVYGHKK